MLYLIIRRKGMRKARDFHLKGLITTFIIFCLRTGIIIISVDAEMC